VDQETKNTARELLDQELRWYSLWYIQNIEVRDSITN
jgi:hypothetical protein